MEFFSLFSLYIVFLLWFAFLFLKYYGISLYTSVYFVYTLLITSPFFIIYAEIENIYIISEVLNRTIDAKVTLSLGNGLKPIILILLFNFIYLTIGTIYSKKFKSIQVSRKIIPISSANKFKKKSIFLLFVTLSYILIRYIFYPDFPLFVIISHGIDGLNMRDVAFYYGSNTNIPYIFLPSINSQFYRIMLPASFFILLFYYQNYMSTVKIKFLLLIVISFVVILNFGTLKRTPILYLATWFILYYFMYKNDLRSIGKIFLGIIVTVGLLIFITTFYTDKSMESVLMNLFARFAIGEAVGEFLAIEHFGNTFDYMYFDIFTVYFQKILGMDVMTFSELWKILSGGTRGYTSIGIIAEFYVSFGWISSFFIMFFTLIILKLDIVFKKNSLSFYRPIISGLITVISFMMVKGFFAQLFTGGVVVLVIISFIVKYNFKFRRYK